MNCDKSFLVVQYTPLSYCWLVLFKDVLIFIILWFCIALKLLIFLNLYFFSIAVVQNILKSGRHLAFGKNMAIPFYNIFDETVKNKIFFSKYGIYATFVSLWLIALIHVTIAVVRNISFCRTRLIIAVAIVRTDILSASRLHLFEFSFKYSSLLGFGGYTL